ncbi:MAG: DUF998 domain-containing protein [Promethearchaeota archaeon]|nr:MAG: DUF998 domain-containing protein [Candidatus Lokiarchaeota archaeon]
MEKLDNFYEKVNGGYIAIILVIIFIVQTLIARYFYLPTNPSYSMTTNYISDLGAGPIETKLTITIAYIIISILLILFILYLVKDLKQRNADLKKTQIIYILGILAGISFLLLGIFHLDPEEPVAYEIHKVAAVMFFGCQGLVVLIYGSIEYKNPKMDGKLYMLSFFAGILFLIFAIGFAIVEYSTLQRQAFVIVVEYIGAYSMLLWLFIKGIIFIRTK